MPESHRERKLTSTAMHSKQRQRKATPLEAEFCNVVVEGASEGWSDQLVVCGRVSGCRSLNLPVIHSSLAVDAVRSKIRPLDSRWKPLDRDCVFSFGPTDDVAVGASRPVPEKKKFFCCLPRSTERGA